MSALKAPKRLASQEGGPPTPAHPERQGRSCSALLHLPSDLLDVLLRELQWKELVALGAVCTQLRALAEDCRLWRQEWEREFGPAGRLQEAAAKRAGGWKALFGARRGALAAAAPWQQPSTFEVEASVDMLAELPPSSGAGGAEPGEATTSAAEPAAEAMPAAEAGGGEIEPAREAELCLVFLVDGSGSVTEDDFRVMTRFMRRAVGALAGAHPAPGAAKVAVVQFSNDVRVEQGPTDVDPEQFEALLAGMHRMNGGTNIVLAIQKAGQLLKPLGPGCRRVLALLTDGRIDSHQAREARDMCARLGDEQGQCGLGLHAYGVGRGVDKLELLRIISAADPETAEDRYLALMVLDEAPW